MYDVILADSPWRFDVWSNKGKAKAPERYYSVMSPEEIGKFIIPANDRSALFMWGVWPDLPGARRVMSDWGFTFLDVAWTWVKSRPSGNGLHIGLGYYTRANTEPCFVGVRGGFEIDFSLIPSFIFSPVREHSRKPDQQYTILNRAFPGARKLEMFARRSAPGWDVWGNEVESNVVIERRE